MILVSLMMTWFSEKMLISTKWTHSFISNLIKKSWTDSTLHSLMYKIIGRNFEYDEALKIIQFEEYTEDIDFDEIKRHDVQKRIVKFNNQKLNVRSGRKNNGDYPGSEDNMKNQKMKVKNISRILKSSVWQPLTNLFLVYHHTQQKELLRWSHLYFFYLNFNVKISLF